jgi:DNA-binding MarR family transcriptional regulator
MSKKRQDVRQNLPTDDSTASVALTDTSVQERSDRIDLEKPSQDRTPELCAALLMESVPLVMRFVRAEMRSQSASVLSVPQFRALNFLDRYPGSSLSELADHLGVTRATASALIERLVQREFISRKEQPKERRQIMLKLTQAGIEHLQQSRAKTRTEIANRLANLSEAQLSDLTEGLLVLGKVFETKIG